MIESVRLKEVRRFDPKQGGGLIVSTDVFVVKDGRSYYSRIEGTMNEGYQRAQFERRQKPGFYRVEG